MADPKHPRKFTEDFKRSIVRQYDEGKSARELSIEFDLSRSTVYRWITGIHTCGSTRIADIRTPEETELIRLRQENKRLRMEVDVLKSAALIFAQK